MAFNSQMEATAEMLTTFVVRHVKIFSIKDLQFLKQKALNCWALGSVVGSVADWLGRQSLTGELSLIYA